MTKKELGRRLDHTILKATATADDIETLCREALLINAASVCVNPSYVKLAAKLLKGSEVAVCTVVGFPLGASTSETKAFEAQNAVYNGATEIDMVINIGALLSGDESAVLSDIEAVVKASGKNCVKVIIETCYLNDAQKISACRLAKKAGASFVKTSTGFGTAGATAYDVALMRDTVGDAFMVKASGGIRDYNTAIIMLNAGADRLGVSASMDILQGAE